MRPKLRELVERSLEVKVAAGTRTIKWTNLGSVNSQAASQRSESPTMSSQPRATARAKVHRWCPESTTSAMDRAPVSSKKILQHLGSSPGSILLVEDSSATKIHAASSARRSNFSALARMGSGRWRVQEVRGTICRWFSRDQIGISHHL